MCVCVCVDHMPVGRLYTSAGFRCFFSPRRVDGESVVVALQSNNKTMIRILTCRPGRLFISSGSNGDIRGRISKNMHQGQDTTFYV